MANCPPLLCVDLIWGQLLVHGLLLQNTGGKQSKPLLFLIET